jgi:hypothetical protein
MFLIGLGALHFCPLLRRVAIRIKQNEESSYTVHSSVIKCQFCYWSDYVIVVILFYLISFYVIHVTCHVMSCHVMSCHVMSCHVMSCHFMSFHVRHFISFHVTSCVIVAFKKAGGRGRAKYVFPGLRRQLRCQAEGKYKTIRTCEP